LYRYDRRTGKNVRLTFDPEYEGYAVHSPDGKILFIREKNRIGHLWVMDADGSHQRQLTDGPTDDCDASYSKDGKSIVFCRWKGGVSHVWVMDNSGANPKPLTDGPWCEGRPVFSPDGTRIAFNRMEEDVPHLRPDPNPTASLRMPELFIVNADGKELHRLTHNWGYEGPISFSPDGDRIFFQRRDEYGAVDGFAGVSVIRTDGLRRRDVCAGHGPVVCPDGRRIVIGLRNPPGIAVMNADDSNLRTIHSCKFPDAEFAFSPDGSQVAFIEWLEVGGAGRVIIVDVETLKTEIVPTID